MIQFEPEIDRSLFQETLQFAKRQVRSVTDKYAGFYPMYTLAGKWKHEGPAWTHWCDGFLPGLMWIFQRTEPEESADKGYWTQKAIEYSLPLEPRQFDRDVHDLGFIFLSTYYRWYQATREPRLNDVLVQAGKTMALRFREKGQYLCSFVGEESLFIDIMMNVGVIFYAARETNDRRLRDMATRHALTTRRYLVRGDGSTAQEGIFDLETGEFLQQSTQQGYRSDSCWSRGLAWAMYGFGSCFEYTRDPRFLQTAQACADYYLTHTGADGVPPGISRRRRVAQNAGYVGGSDRGRRADSAVPDAAGSGEGLLLLVLRAENSEDAVLEVHGPQRRGLGRHSQGRRVPPAQGTGRRGKRDVGRVLLLRSAGERAAVQSHQRP